jgi:Mitochondrial protein Pet127
MYLQDPRSLVYNFDPYLENIMPMDEFDYDALMEYITSSRDTTLGDMAREHGANFVGSTSSMTSSLCHFHFLLSAWRPVNISMLSSEFATAYKSFTAMTRSPAGIFLRYKGDGVYAIDADKMYDTNETVLQWLGRSMEKMLTLPPEQMEKYRKTQSHMLEPHERGQPEGYHYTLSNTILMRSQLDCNDARLPGTGVFDLKTRACLAVRMNVHGYEVGADYEIRHLTGLYNSFEREYYDMIRSAFLKYSLQVRIGNMDGIFVAYHNTKRIFGFQYISLDEMDAAIHGNPEVGKQEFHFSVKLFNETLSRAVQQFPRKVPLSLFFLFLFFSGFFG